MNGLADSIDLVNTYRERLAALPGMKAVTVGSLSVEKASSKTAFGIVVGIK